jgi:putative hydrolase of the HAD superfamily
MRPQAIFLDLDGTMLDFDRAAWDDSVRAVIADLGGSVAGIDPARLAGVYAEISTRHFRAAEAAGDAPADGHAIWAELWRETLAECGHRADDALVAQAVAAYERERGARYRLFADVLPALRRLREQVSALVLITNGPGSTQRHKADATGLAGLFDAVIISGEAGVSKPDPAIFRLAAAAAGMPLSAAWHVGDSLTSDVAGAVGSGLGAGVWLNRTAAALPPDLRHRPDYEIASLGELPGLLAG